MLGRSRVQSDGNGTSVKYVVLSTYNTVKHAAKAAPMSRILEKHSLARGLEEQSAE